MTTLTFPPINFLISAAHPKQFPTDTGHEVAFAGRSNSGKSSAINTITGHKKLAKTSKTPGRTQLINFFSITEQQRLVDLPGYGYAKVAVTIKQQWNALLGDYLTHRQSLRGIFLIMDIRHPLQELDQQMLRWAEQQQLATHLLLSKTDKLSRRDALKTLALLERTLATFTMPNSVQLFSSHNKTGLPEAREKLLAWLA